MAYEGKTIWKNREVENPRTFMMQQNPDGTITLIPAEGTIIEPGTPIIAAIMNNIEDGIEEAHNSIGNINDPTLPAELKGKALTEQTKYVLSNAGKVKSVNNKTGDVVLSSSDVGAVPTSRTVNNKALNANISLTASDVGAVPTSRTVNGKALNSNVIIDVPDINGLNSSKLQLAKSAIASGNSSVAIGDGATATKEHSVAIGTGTVASGGFGVCIGFRTEAVGLYSFAIGTGAAANNPDEGIFGSGDSKVKIPGSFTVSGTKNFEIPHPHPDKKATHMLRHAAVESPTAGDTLYRYQIQSAKENDLVTIDLPDYFIHLNKDVQIFVTPQGHFGNGYGELNRETEQLEIQCQYEGRYNVLVIGTRNDDHQSVQDWDIKGVEREIGESWTGETYAFEVDEIMEIDEIKEVA